MEIVLFFVLGFSLTNAVVFLRSGHIFRKKVSGLSDEEFHRCLQSKYPGRLKGFRQEIMGRFVRCHACIGFWVGTAISAGQGGVAEKYLNTPAWIVDLIADGFIISGVNFVLWVVLKKLGVDDL